MSKQTALPVCAAILFHCCVASFAAAPPDYSKEAVVVEKMATNISFSADGARDWRQTLAVRVQSEGAVRQFGILAFSYSSGSERMQIEYVRVRKADGSVVATPDSSVMDAATQVATDAPTYSDLRQKQVPVTALAVGDVLEYSVHSTQDKPEFPGQFWYEQAFDEDAVVLSQTLEITLPKDKYVQVVSPDLKAEMHEENDRRTYKWSHSHLQPSDPDKKPPAVEKDAPKVQITTFKSWEEVGNWWATLASPQAVVSPAIQNKADELTAGLSSNSDKAHAIYSYVAMKYRYISISLGEGRYRPHTAAEVFANQYGDCKDKHTLFTALLKAAGIQAWPALIGAGLKFNDSVPSPAQFNHVITVLPQDGKYLWLDTTAEVAPFGFLIATIRDQQALLIPTGGKAVVQKTPAEPATPARDSIVVKSALSEDGTLTGRFEFKLTGDNALLFRSAFRQLAPIQWQAVVQQSSYAMGFAGDVSNVKVENIEEPEKQLAFGYDYTRKTFSDWAERKITLPVPYLGFGPGEEAEKPKEPIVVGSKGTLTYSAFVQLPKGFTVEQPADVKLTSDFADYAAHYTLGDGTLAVERTLVIKQANVSLDQWDGYKKLIQGVRTDQTTFLSVTEAAASATVPSKELDALMQRIGTALAAQNLNEARELLAQAERLSPKGPRIWLAHSVLADADGKTDEAITDARKEIKNFPNEIPAFQRLSFLLIRAGRKNEAIEAWRSAVAIMPEDQIAATQLSTLLMEDNRYSEVPDILEQPIAAAPNNFSLKSMRVEALLRDGRKDQGIAEAKALVEAKPEPIFINNMAYFLCDTNTAMDLAAQWGQLAVDQFEQETAKSTLDSVEQQDLIRVHFMAAAWDTLGWIYFARNDLSLAEAYVDAAWQLSQTADVGYHLGRIYDKQGKHSAAIHTWQMSLAAHGRNQEARESLRQAGAPHAELSASPSQDDPQAAALEELTALRTTKVPSLPKQTGSGDFSLLISRHGVEDVRATGSGTIVGDASAGLKAAKWDFRFPDNGPEKMIRQGILSCSALTTPSCRFTLLLTASARARAKKPENSVAAPPAPVDGLTHPTLISKVEPEYTEAARHAGLEGTVLLSVALNKDGIPEEVKVVKPLGLGLDESALECVKKWRFHPATNNGEPVPMLVKVEVAFRLLQAPQ